LRLFHWKYNLKTKKKEKRKTKSLINQLPEMERDREWEVAELGVAVDEVKRKKRKTKARRNNNGGFDLLLHDIVWFFFFFFCYSFFLCVSWRWRRLWLVFMYVSEREKK
jgi:hypothetical protein